MATGEIDVEGRPFDAERAWKRPETLAVTA